MLFDLPDTATLYAALVARDPAYDGRAFVGVSSTGVFCRLTCPARKPLLQNCQFFETVGGCLEAGFRACKRCAPLGYGPQADPMIGVLLEALEQGPARRWRESDLVARGFDPSTVRRVFRRHYGIGFLDMARLMRLRSATEVLAEGGQVIEAQWAAGYASGSAFRRAFAALLGVAPGKLQAKAMLQADWIDTPLGAMVAVADQTHLHLLEFADRKGLPAEVKKLHGFARGNMGFGRPPPVVQVAHELQRYFAADPTPFTVPLALHGTGFSKQVWHQLQQIPAGTTTSYGTLARAMGQPTASRAVARANGANQIAILIPCHRVIGADGSLTGYGGGLWRKQKLIEIETSLRANQTVATL